MSFWRKNLAFFRLSVQNHLEYRANYLTDAVVAPVLAALIEVALWTGIFRALSTNSLNGFGLEHYLSYAIWASFIARITVNWMYEHRMIDEIESGSVNSLLVRPIPFYQAYLFQYLGYKMVTTLVSLSVPLSVCLFLDLPLLVERLPLALLLIVYYVILAHTISFCVATIAFSLNRVYSLTTAKNLALWLLSGELIPLDLLPQFWRDIVLALPFSNAVYIPTGYLTGRIGPDLLVQGFLTTTAGLVVFGTIANWSWNSGIRAYSGTGA